MIVAQPTEESYETPITGIAGHKDFTLITIDKAMMNAEYGFGRRVLQALEDFDVSFEHLPTGIDTMCVVISDKELLTRKEQIIQRVGRTCQPEADRDSVRHGADCDRRLRHGAPPRYRRKAVRRAVSGGCERAHD